MVLLHQLFGGCFREWRSQSALCTEHIQRLNLQRGANGRDMTCQYETWHDRTLHDVDVKAPGSTHLLLHRSIQVCHSPHAPSPTSPHSLASQQLFTHPSSVSLHTLPPPHTTPSLLSHTTPAVPPLTTPSLPWQPTFLHFCSLSPFACCFFSAIQSAAWRVREACSSRYCVHKQMIHTPLTQLQ